MADRRLLLKDGVAVALGGRAFDILSALLEHPGEVVSTRDLIGRVWANVTVDDGSLRFQVQSLRKALGDGQDGARYIVNVRGEGYCCVAPIARDAARVRPERPATSTTPELPSRMAGIVGRDEVVRALGSQLAAERFVTIVGPGGIGKSTVAVAVAHDQLARLHGSVHFVDLGSVSDPNLVSDAVAAGLGLVVQARDPIRSIVSSLQGKRTLIVLDACEHVIQSAARLAEQVFREAPETEILATSREPLRVAGEHVFRLPPLDSPPASTTLTLAQACELPAVQLFVEHARAGGAATTLGDADAGEVGAICRKLDGNPLAIELVAGNFEAYGLRKIVELLDGPLSLSLRGRRTASPRQQTLAATIDWSYQLLGERERSLLEQVSIFSGGFTVEAAFGVVGEERINRSQVAGTIADLVAKSLVAGDPTGSAASFRLLNTTRAYLRERLRDRGEADALAARHARYWLGVLERASAHSATATGETSAFEDLLENVRAALHWCFSPTGDVSIGLALAPAAAPLFLRLVLVDEWCAWINRARAALDESQLDAEPGIKVQAWHEVSLLLTKGADADSDALLAKRLALVERLGQPHDQVRLLAALYLATVMVGNIHRALLVAERTARVVDESCGCVAVADSILATAYALSGDLARSQRHIEAALFRTPPPQGTSSFFLGFEDEVHTLTARPRILWMRGFPDQATAATQHVVNPAAELADREKQLMAILGTIPVLLWAGDWNAAETMIRMGFATSSPTGPSGIIHTGLIGFRGCLSVVRGAAAEGVADIRASLEAFGAVGFHALLSPLSVELAIGLARLGRVNDAIAIAESALVRANTNGEGYYVAELQRLNGTLLMQAEGSNRRGAEVYYQGALQTARGQGALSWELRAATDLARLWRDDGRADEAQPLLASVFAQFTEGFGTRDLKAAQGLLDELNAAGR